MFKVIFETNIDFYHHRKFPTVLNFRPQLGDRVPFEEQEKYYPKYPILEITNIQYYADPYNQILGFVCYLDFSKHTHPDTCKQILNHKDL